MIQLWWPSSMSMFFSSLYIIGCCNYFLFILCVCLHMSHTISVLKCSSWLSESDTCGVESKTVLKLNWTPWPLVHKWTIPTERPPLVGKVSANFCRERVSRGQRNGFPWLLNLGFLDRSHYFFIQVTPQLSSRGWVDPVPDPLLLHVNNK
jgi:hypothetical protein